MLSFLHHYMIYLLSFILLASCLESSLLSATATATTTVTATATATATVHIYRQVQSYQVLQRQRDTNTAWVETLNGEQHQLAVGGPYKVDDAHHVMVGDLWVLAGQSNMEGYAYFDHHGAASHVFQSNESWGRVPANQPVHALATSPRVVHHIIPDPTVANPSVLVDRGASLGPAFAHHYFLQSSHVPVGLLPCAHGGVSLAQWMKPPQQQEEIANTTLYGAMLDTIRLVGGAVTGVLWYQGESDAIQLPLAQQYQQQFTQWLHQMYLDLPNDCIFVFAQIGRYVAPFDSDLGWSLVRKAQLDVFRQQQQQQRNVAIVSTLDMDMDDDIHLSAASLRQVGQRMADAACRLMMHSAHETPTTLYALVATMVHVPYKSCWRHLLRIDFGDPAPSWLHQDRVTGFTIHDTQLGVPLDIIYSVRINNNNGTIDLYLTENGYQQLVAATTTITAQAGRFVLWYGYGKNPQCNLVTIDHQAALAFGPLPINVTRI